MEMVFLDQKKPLTKFGRKRVNQDQIVVFDSLPQKLKRNLKTVFFGFLEDSFCLKKLYLTAPLNLKLLPWPAKGDRGSSEYSSVTNSLLQQPFDQAIPLNSPPICVMCHIPTISPHSHFSSFFWSFFVISLINGKDSQVEQMLKWRKEKCGRER